MNTIYILIMTLTIILVPVLFVLWIVQAIRKKTTRKIKHILLLVLFVFAFSTITAILLTCDHEWSEATSTTPKTCTLCGKTEGDVREDNTGNAESSKPASSNNNSNNGSYNYSNISGARHTDSEAWVCAKNIVKGSLKSPSTAKFCFLDDATVTHLGSGEYMVTGWVDAQNDFGAVIREYFVVTYTATSSGYKNGHVIFD